MNEPRQSPRREAQRVVHPLAQRDKPGNAIPSTPEAKLWELLRRNRKFRKTVARLAQLDARARTAAMVARKAKAAAESCAEATAISHEARLSGSHILKRCESNPFAVLALRWLVPNPIFLHRKVGLPPDSNPKQRFVTPETIRLGRNYFPEPEHGRNWTWFGRKGRLTAEGLANLAGWRNRWGPEIQTVVTDEPRLKRLCRDEIAEWRAFFKRSKFDLDTPWQETPAPFRRAFTGLWSRVAGGTLGVEETMYFQGRNPYTRLIEAAEVANKAILHLRELVQSLAREKRGKSVRVAPQFAISLSPEELARLFQFNALARRRVFVVPHVLRRADAKKVAESLHRQLVAQLPDEHELLGTGLFWETGLELESLAKQPGIEKSAAVRIFIVKTWGVDRVQSELRDSRDQLSRWFKDGVLLPAPPRHQRGEYAEWRRITDADQRLQLVNAFRDIPAFLGDCIRDVLSNEQVVRVDASAFHVISIEVNEQGATELHAGGREDMSLESHVLNLRVFNARRRLDLCQIPILSLDRNQDVRTGVGVLERACRLKQGLTSAQRSVRPCPTELSIGWTRCREYPSREKPPGQFTNLPAFTEGGTSGVVRCWEQVRPVALEPQELWALEPRQVAGLAEPVS